MLNWKNLVSGGFLALAVMAAPLAAPAYDQGTKAKMADAAKAAGAAAKSDIVATAVAAGKFTTLAALLTKAGLVETLQGEGPYTVFAPTDEAFAKVPAETLAALGNDPEKLKAVLLYHVAAGKLVASDVVKAGDIKTVEGSPVAIASKEGKVFANNAQVVATDIAASNGVIHVIDAVLLPPAKPNIVEVAVGAGQFKTLAALLTKAGLVDTLKGEGPFTVFAPTDEAFAKVPAATLEALGNDPEQLKAVLLYHVVSGKVTAEKVVTLSSAKTVQGADVKITAKDGKVQINQANVVSADVPASNGVIHVIDAVILPPAK